MIKMSLLRIRNIWGKILYLVEPTDRIRFFGVGFLTLLGAAAETFSLGLILPLIYLISEPDNIREQPFLNTIYILLGEPSFHAFVIIVVSTVAVVFIGKNVYLMGMTYTQNMFAARVQERLSQRLITSYLQQAYTYHLHKNPAELANIVNVEALQFGTFVLRPFLRILTDSITTLGIVLLLLMIEPFLMLVAILFIGLPCLVFFFYSRKLTARFAQRRFRTSQEKARIVYQLLGGIKEINVLNRSATFLQRFQVVEHKFTRVLAYLATINMTPRMVIETFIVVCGLATVAIILVQGFLFAALLPTVSLFAGAVYRITPLMTRTVGSINQIMSGLPTIHVLHRDLSALSVTALDAQDDQEPGKAVHEASHDGAYAIVLKQVSYCYPETEKPTLSDISLGIARNQSVGIVGSSGAGKTTLVDVMLGLLPPTIGQVFVNGHDIHHTQTEWHHWIGYIPQQIYLADDTIRANVAFGIEDANIDDKQVHKVLEIAQLAAFVTQLPQGLHTFVGEHGVKLSGGQRQRIGIARALYHEPDIIIMDEATAALDNQTEHAFIEAIAALQGKKTMIIIAHRLTTIKRCDIVYFMEYGQIVNAGTYDELLVRDDRFQAMATPASSVINYQADA
jgi:ATP-binding cassette subfamily C protein